MQIIDIERIKKAYFMIINMISGITVLVTVFNAVAYSSPLNGDIIIGAIFFNIILRKYCPIE